jgi:transcriptional regulator with XRE-family HTH domain
MHVDFGHHLRSWRGRRHMSQLDLALAADVSARHVSFLESGRAKPSRAMVLQLCEALEVPMLARNAFLDAAGFAAAYQRRDFTSDDLAPFEHAVSWTLDRHAPYPAFAIDRHWRLLKTNSIAAALLGAVGVSTGTSLLDAFTEQGPLRDAIENYEELRSHMRQRLMTENRHLGGDAVLERAIAKLSTGESAHSHDRLPLMVPTRLRFGDHRLALVSTLAQFGTVNDIAVAELKIELLFPADETTEKTLHDLASQPA